MDNYLKNILDEIARITFEIYEVYNQIIYTVVNKDYLIDYEDRIKDLTAKLALLRIDEDKEYSLIEDSIASISLLLNYLLKNENNKMDEKARLCFMRIKNNFNLLMLFRPYEELKIGIEAFNNDPKHLFLIDSGITEEDAIEFARKFKFSFEKSISHRYITFVNEMIKKESNLSEKTKLLKIKFDSVFVYGNEVEEDLMENYFERLKNNLSEEIENSFGLDQRLKKHYLNMAALLSVYKNVNKLNKLMPSISATKLIIEFKVFILYLDDYNLEELKNNIEKLKFASEAIRSLLIQAIDSNEISKKLHNSDSAQMKF